MPMPNPGDTETREVFLKRCMGDDVMNREYEDAAQRYAVCNSQWRRRHQKKGGERDGQTEKGSEKNSQKTSKKEGIIHE